MSSAQSGGTGSFRMKKLDVMPENRAVTNEDLAENETKSEDTGTLPPRQVNSNRMRFKSIEDDASFIDELMVSFRSTIEKQRESIKFRDEQIEQLKTVHEHEMTTVKAELTKEITRLQNKREVELFYC